MKNKKAQAHVEIIISFILFIGVILIFFTLVKPLPKSTEIPINQIQESIINQISLEIGKISAITDNTKCYSLNTVIDDYGTNFIEIPDTLEPRRYFIYFHPIFTQSSISCSERSANPEDFTLGTYTTEKIIFNPLTETLKADYNTNYQQLKTTLNINSNYNFAIIFKNLQGNTIQELTPDNKQPPTGINVIAKDIPVRVIDNQGEINEYILNLRVW